MDGRTAHLDRNSRVERSNGGLKGLEREVLVREDAEHPSIDAEADAGVYVLFRRLEPSVTLGLRKGSELGRRRAAGSHIPA